MSYKVEATEVFEKRLKPLLKKYPSILSDLRLLNQQLAENPHQGDGLGQNCYKVRLAIRSKNTGKSGGARVITLVQILDEQVLLLTIYGKSDRADLRPGELEILLKLLE
ncbi:type II toxin-antitoxin system RelE/ParE family toxin [Hymenobacter sp. IS2118]|uniref:type II toxin-antitoxin system RelE/ParE family toxin n=1 Tax=Hymenobacter sp. IS2118 TaxID=1505605 RepID=UPI0005528B87|nr:type II toxin-antitoxin system RelE/ParE family toxin [Hymenobacter sp. IS2118]